MTQNQRGSSHLASSSADLGEVIDFETGSDGLEIGPFRERDRFCLLVQARTVQWRKRTPESVDTKGKGENVEIDMTRWCTMTD